MDDVLALLSSPAPSVGQQANTTSQQQQQKFLLQNCQSNQLLAPSVSSFSSEQSTLYQDLNSKLNHSNNSHHQQQQQQPVGTMNDFDAKIRELEEQAKLFRIHESASRNSSKPSTPVPSKYKNVCFNTSESTSNLSQYQQPYQHPSMNTNFSNLQINTKSYTPNTANRLSEIKNEENYLEQIKQKLDMQLRETEHLKTEMARSKQQPAYQPVVSMQYQGDGHVYRATPSYTGHSVGNHMNSNSNGYVDELVDLRLKLKESYAVNEELKLTFRKNLGELQNTLSECIEDKDKFMLKK